jgi:hypothetical protein
MPVPPRVLLAERLSRVQGFVQAIFQGRKTYRLTSCWMMMAGFWQKWTCGNALPLPALIQASL